VTEMIFGVLYVSIMGITYCYKTTVFLTFIFAVFLLNLFYICILLHKSIYGFVKTNRNRIGIVFLVSVFLCIELSATWLWRH